MPTLTDQFYVTNIKDGDKTGAPIFSMTCKACSKEFDADTDILFPKNVKHALGRSITFTCPGCKIQAHVTCKQNALELCDLAIHVTTKKLEEMGEVPATKFLALDADYDKLDAHMLCTKCEKEFDCDFHKQLNTTTHEDSTGRSVAIICPHCGETDAINQDLAEKRLLNIALTLRLQLLQNAREELLKETD